MLKVEKLVKIEKMIIRGCWNLRRCWNLRGCWNLWRWSSLPGAAWSRGDDPQRGRTLGKGRSLKMPHIENWTLTTTIQSWEAIPPDTAAFTPDISPLILAAHTDNYEIIKILLDRGAVLPCPHHQRYQALLPSPHHQRLRIRVLTTSRDPSSSSSSLLFVLSL